MRRWPSHPAHTRARPRRARMRTTVRDRPGETTRTRPWMWSLPVAENIAVTHPPAQIDVTGRRRCSVGATVAVVAGGTPW